MKCALIGLGMVAPTHVAAVQASDCVSLCGVLGRDAVKAFNFAQSHSVDHVYDTLDALCSDTNVDFAILATPPDTRRAFVDAFVAAGIPILMEKPIERTFDAARDIVTACDSARVPLGVMFQHRARAASQALKTVLDSGQLGQISNAEIRVPWWRDQSYYDAPGRGSYARDGGGVMITQAIHTLDLALWMLGPVASVQAMMHRTPLHKLEAENWAGALLRFSSGAVGSLTATTSAFPGNSESLVIQGTLGSASLCDGVLTLRYLDGREDVVGATASTGGGADPMAFTHAWHQTMIEDFAAAVRDKRAPLAPGEDALRAQAVIHAMEQASAARTEIEMDVT